MRYLNCEECGRSLGLKMEFCRGKHYCPDCLERLIREGRIVRGRDFQIDDSGDSSRFVDVPGAVSGDD